MRSLFELISKYKSDVIIVPIIAFIAFVVTLFMYIFINKKKIYKYIPSFITLFAGLVLFIKGYFNLLEISGLNTIDLAAKFLIFGFISLFLALIFDLLDSIGKNSKTMVKKNNTRRKVNKK